MYESTAPHLPCIHLSRYIPQRLVVTILRTAPSASISNPIPNEYAIKCRAYLIPDYHHLVVCTCDASSYAPKCLCSLVF